ILKQRDGRKLPRVAERFKEESKKLIRAGKPAPKDLLDLAEGALTHGLITEFEKTMGDLVTADATHPAAAAYTKIKGALALKINHSTAAQQWLEKYFKGFKVATNDFYALLQKQPEASPDVASRLRNLRNN